MDDVHEVEYSARIYAREHTPELRGGRAFGLLVTSGRATDLARGYAEDANPRVYITTPDELPATLGEILAALREDSD
jgi:hypothetical protein